MRGLRGWGIVAAFVLVACGLQGTDYRHPTPPTFLDAGVHDGGPPDAGTSADAGDDAGVLPPDDSGMPDAGRDGGTGTLTVGEWNLDFYGKADAGPDDGPQQANVLTVIGNANLDVWGLEEVCDDAAFSRLVAGLRTQYGEDYGWVLPDDPSTVSNPNPDYGGPWAQKTALLYRKDRASVMSAQLVYRPDIDPSWYRAFPAERDPLEVHLRVSAPSGPEDLWVLVIHLKAGDAASDYDRRAEASADLHAYLQQAHPSDPVMVIGDWNDDLDQSICETCGSPEGVSPFESFLSDESEFLFPTLELSESGASTVIRYPRSVIDHQMIDGPLFGAFDGGVGLVNVAMIPGYALGNTSDHYPTRVRYHLP